MTEALPVLLVHGAWHGAWCWSELIPFIRDGGRCVDAPDLPGHGADSLSPARTSLKRYVSALETVLRSQRGPWIVVAHSMAGIPATLLASRHPDGISSLIYLNAYVPSSGDSVFSLMDTLCPDSAIARAMQFSPDKRTVALDPTSTASLFCNASPATFQELTRSSICLQGSLPLSQKAEFDQNHLAGVRKVAVCANGDRVIPPSLQRAMLKRQPCDEFILVEGDHSLFFSDPQNLAQLILAQ